MALTIVASIRAKSGHEDAVAAELTKLVDPTRRERGCLQYDLHRNDEDSAHFLFYENWETRDLWLAHMESDHIAAYRNATEGWIDDFVLYEMTRTA